MAGETEKEILSILDDAIRREVAAQKMYQRGAALAENAEVKAVFEQLHAEELGHEELIRKVYYNYKKQLGLKVIDKE